MERRGKKEGEKLFDKRKQVHVLMRQKSCAGYELDAFCWVGINDTGNLDMSNFYRMWE